MLAKTFKFSNRILEMGLEIQTSHNNNVTINVYEA